MYTQIGANKRKTIYLMAGFVLFIALSGWVFSRWTGNPGLIVMMTVFAVVYAVVGYYASAAIALALNGAKPVEKRDAPELYRIVENLAITAGLPTPKIYIMNDTSPNAFATGRDPQHAVVAVTTGALELFDKQELEGVLAHELSHVGNYDIRLMAVVIVLVTIVSFLSNFVLRFTFWGGSRDRESNDQSGAIFAIVGLVLVVLSPIIATLLQLAVSRRREFLADASGALLTRYPDGLASALKKIENYPRGLRQANTATAHLFLANPFKKGGGVAGLFSTHPPIEERIKRLEGMEVQP